MADRILRIDRIDLRLRGVSPAAARELADLLGPALKRGLARTEAVQAEPRRIEAVKLDPVTAERSASGRELSSTVARTIARSIQKSVKRGR